MHISLPAFRESAALASSICAALIAFFFRLCCFGFGDNLPGPVLLSLGLSWFLINFPFAVKQRWGGTQTSCSWLTSDGLLTLFGLSCVMLLGMFFGKMAGVPVAICGALFLLWR